MGRKLVPSGGNDRVMSPPDLARRIVAHFAPSGRVMEPCRGSGSFFNAFPEHCARLFCEIDEGIDFLQCDVRSDWIITNPPFSLFRAFLKQSMALADHVVFLSFINAFWMKARLRDIHDAGFSLREIVLIDTPTSRDWPQSGFQCGVTYLARGEATNIITTDWRMQKEKKP